MMRWEINSVNYWQTTNVFTDRHQQLVLCCVWRTVSLSCTLSKADSLRKGTIVRILNTNCLHNGCFQKYRRVGMLTKALAVCPVGLSPTSLTSHFLYRTSGVRWAVRQSIILPPMLDYADYRPTLFWPAILMCSLVYWEWICAVWNRVGFPGSRTNGHCITFQN